MTAKEYLAHGRAQSRIALTPIAVSLAAKGRWDEAMRAMTLQLLDDRARIHPPSALSFCAHAALQSGRWMSALFWIERAHAQGIPLPSQTYDDFFSLTKSWRAALQLIPSMKNVGAHSSEEGVLELIKLSSQSAKAERAIDVLYEYDAVEWVP